MYFQVEKRFYYNGSFTLLCHTILNKESLRNSPSNSFQPDNLPFNTTLLLFPPSSVPYYFSIQPHFLQFTEQFPLWQHMKYFTDIQTNDTDHCLENQLSYQKQTSS